MNNEEWVKYFINSDDPEIINELRNYVLKKKRYYMNCSEDLLEQQKINRKAEAEERRLEREFREKNRIKEEIYMIESAERERQYEEESQKGMFYIGIIFFIGFIIFVLVFEPFKSSSYDEDSGSETYGRYGQQ